MDNIIEWAKANPMILIIGVVVFMFWDKIAAFFPSKPGTPVDPTQPPTTTPPPVVVVPAVPITTKIENLINLVIKFWPIIAPMIPKAADPKMQAAQDLDVVRIESAIEDLKRS